MGSNNYAEIVTDPIAADLIIAKLKHLAALGTNFKVMRFDPEDEFKISMGRYSNLPTLEDVEGTDGTVDGRKLWRRREGSFHAVDFGNSYVGLFYQADGKNYMATVAPKRTVTKKA